MKRLHKLILSGALVLVVGIVAVAINIPNTFVDGTPISASDMNQNFRVIQRDLNRNVVRIDPNNGYALVKGLYAKNPNNPSANFNFDWLNDVPRLRVGGTGVGSKTGLDIQTQGDRSLMRLHYDGSVNVSSLLASAALSVYNHNNNGAALTLDFLNDVARFRVGGTGPGVRNGFDFQTVGNRSLMRLHYDGTVDIKDLLVRGSIKGNGEQKLYIDDSLSVSGSFYARSLTTDYGIVTHSDLFASGDITSDRHIYAKHANILGSVEADSFITRGADLSEPFDITSTKQLEPGMVVSIDPKDPGKLQVSTEAYDRKVAGIISGAGGVKTGIILKQEDVGLDGEYPVALTGRVYAWADASYGAIGPGDLLTTSETPGYAMKVNDYDRSEGAILGKAMSSLDDGQGLVLVLIRN